MNGSRLDKAVSILTLAAVLASIVIAAVPLVMLLRPWRPDTDPPGAADPAAYEVGPLIAEAEEITRRAAEGR